MAQVADSGAAARGQRRQGARVGAQGQQLLQHLAAPLQRCAAVGRAQGDEGLQARGPGSAAGLGDRAARHQPAHAVPEQRDRPGHVVQQLGQLGAVAPDRAAAVVAQSERAPAQPGERGGEVGTLAAPLRLVHAQAMQQDQRGAAAARHQRVQAHPRGQRVAAVFQVVAQQAVQRRHRRLRRAGPLGPGPVEQRFEGAEGQVQPAPDQPGGAAHAAVDEAGDARGAVAVGTEGQARDLRVHGLHQVDDALGGGDRETAGAAQLLGAGHRAIMPALAATSAGTGGCSSRPPAASRCRA
mmetsp:Transcript_17177/g.66860  ORF Transcript_17177/g.66860 Transcript_17177/m.66860 type:complete len:297 (+) Transcript_17177:3884-4774(+)